MSNKSKNRIPFSLEGASIVDACHNVIAGFLNEDLARNFFDAYTEKVNNLSKTASEIKADSIIKCFEEFNEFIEAGGTITKKSIMHFGIMHVLQNN